LGRRRAAITTGLGSASGALQRRHTALLQVASMAGRVSDPTLFAQAAMEQARAALAADVLGISLLEGADDTLVLTLVDGASPALVERSRRLPLSESHLFRMAQETGVPVSLAVDDHHNPRLRALLWADGLRNLALAPMMSRGVAVGAFFVARKASTAFSAEDLEFLAALGVVLGAAFDTAEAALKTSGERLRRSQEELRGLAAHLVAIREEERTRIAREIHDELGQTLTALRIDLSWLSERLTAAGGGPLAPRLEERLRVLPLLVDQAIGTVRRIATELRPAVLDDLGLAAAVEWQVQEFRLRTSIPCRLHSSLKSQRVPRDVATAAFRIFQETLTNVARHAKASAVFVKLGASGGHLLLEVSDDGRGIPPEALRSHRSVGLVGMRERALGLGGQVRVENAAGHGTRVRVRLPLRPRGKARP
jgi:signal transduction histidine kinase